MWADHRIKTYGKYGKRYGGYDYGYGYESSSADGSEKKNQAFLDAAGTKTASAFGE